MRKIYHRIYGLIFLIFVLTFSGCMFPGLSKLMQGSVYYPIFTDSTFPDDSPTMATELDLRFENIPYKSDNFIFENRYESFIEFNSHAKSLYRSGEYRIIRNFLRKKNSLANAFFDHHPVLELVDRNRNDKVDEFAYFPKAERKTMEFGFIFDTNNDGKIDYLVFNGGPIGDGKRFDWQNYHFIDSNHDGEVDIIIFFNNIDRDFNKKYDYGIIACVYDMNYDGYPDSAEYLGTNYSEKITPVNGTYIIKTIFGLKRFDSNFSFKSDLMNLMMRDINSIIR